MVGAARLYPSAMARVTYRATIAYDGARFTGFSRQKDQRTVEGTLLEALRTLMPEITTVACGGRTDKGVHATGQVISFWSRGPLDRDRLFAVLDGAAPDALAVRSLEIVPRRFHASFSAVARRYSYFHQDDGEADVDALDALLGHLVGRRCFSAFARDTPRGRSTVRRLLLARAHRWAPDVVRFDFRASGFLRRQVRVTVATALQQAAAGAPAERLAELAASGDRRATAPAIDGGGLYLVGVDYA